MTKGFKCEICGTFVPEDNEIWRVTKERKDATGTVLYQHVADYCYSCYKRIESLHGTVNSTELPGAYKRPPIDRDEDNSNGAGLTND